MDSRIIAMWSGPRNISTAMMRSWGSRADTTVIDEPFYAHYLVRTGYDHPGAAEVIETYETDWRKVVTQITGDIPHNKSIYFQKHMTHHMLDHMDRSWMANVSNCFLIRDPRRMILSFSKVIPEPKADQMGLAQQVELFNYVREMTGEIPPVISSKDVLTNPRETLSKLCAAIDVPFDEAMLSWKAGAHEADGIWGIHWYKSLENSTGFNPYHEDNTPLPPHLQPILDECQGMYDQMAQYCIR